MSRRQHFLETNDRAREQNLRFVRNREDEFQQFFGGSGGGNGPAPPRDYKVVTPKPGTSRGMNMNTLEDRKRFFSQVGLPRNESSEWANRSVQKTSFEVDNFQNRRDNLQQSNFNMNSNGGFKTEFPQPTSRNNSDNLHLNRNIPALMQTMPMINFPSNIGRSRSRSPLNDMRWGNSQLQQQQQSMQRPSDYPADNKNFISQQQAVRDNFPINRNEFPMESKRIQPWQNMGSNINSNNMPQNVYNNNSSRSGFEGLVQQNQMDRGNWSDMNNQQQFQQNPQNFDNQRQGFGNNNMGAVANTFNRNSRLDNYQQSQQFDNGQWSGRNTQHFNNSNNSNFSNNDGFNQQMSQQSFQGQSNNNEEVSAQALMYLLQNPNIQQLVQRSDQFQGNSQRYNGNNSQRQQQQGSRNLRNGNPPRSLPAANARGSQNLRGQRRAEIKRRPAANQQSKNLQRFRGTGLLRTNDQSLVKQTKNAASKTVNLKLVSLPKPKGAVPNRRNWISWWKTNSWVRAKIIDVKDDDPEVIKAFSIPKNKQAAAEALKSLNENYEKLGRLLKAVRENKKLRDPYGFFKSVISLHELLYTNSGRGINQNLRKAGEDLLKQIDIIDMITYYRILISKWKGSYSNLNNAKAKPNTKLKKFMEEKVYNWIMKLALDEIKRISNPIINPKKKSQQIKELYEFCAQLPQDKKDKILHFDETKSSADADAFVKTTIAQLNETIKKEVKIDEVSSKKFASLRVRLTDNVLNGKLSPAVKKEKDAFVKKLKNDPYSKKNCNFIVNYAIQIHQQVMNLQEANPKLMVSREKEKKNDLKRWITHNELKVILAFLIEERLAEYGGYLTDEEAADTTECNLVFEFEIIPEKNPEDDTETEKIDGPVKVPQTKEEQYKELVKFSSSIDVNTFKKIFFFDSEQLAAADFVRMTMNYIKSYLEKKESIKTRTCKKFIIAKIRLSDPSIDALISLSLKNQKNTLLAKLRKDVFAQKNYEHLLDFALNMRMRYLHLRSMDEKLLKESEKGEILGYEKVSRNQELKFICKHLLDERFALTGSYLSKTDQVELKTPNKAKLAKSNVTLTKESLRQMHDVKEEPMDSGDEHDNDNDNEQIDDDEHDNEQIDDDEQNECEEVIEIDDENEEDETLEGEEEIDDQYEEEEAIDDEEQE